MNRLVECVPNFSEGKNDETIRAVCERVRKTGVRVVSCDPDADYNRTVLTFVGDPATVLEGAFATIDECARRIDMRNHKGGHPRMGACDVTPFIPVSDVSLPECAQLARELGERVSAKLGLPVYLYGAAAKEGKQDLAYVRKGQYEGLPEKIKNPDWVPDYGPAEFYPKFGAALIGARPFLIAYNVNLQSPDVAAADEIAKRVRTSGRKVDGKKIQGSLQSVKGMGVLLKEKNIAQVSMNLVDYSVTNMHQAFEEAKKLAIQFGQTVTGSEICGVVPAEAILESGRYYGGNDLDEDAAIDLAVKNLGLADIDPFYPEKKVLELFLKAEQTGDPCGML